MSLEKFDLKQITVYFDQKIQIKTHIGLTEVQSWLYMDQVSAGIKWQSTSLA